MEGAKSNWVLLQFESVSNKGRSTGVDISSYRLHYDMEGDGFQVSLSSVSTRKHVQGLESAVHAVVLGRHFVSSAYGSCGSGYGTVAGYLLVLHAADRTSRRVLPLRENDSDWKYF